MPFHDPIERLATSFIPSSTQRRRVLLAVDVLLGLAICWAALAPLPDSDLGATSGYVEPNLDHRVAAQAHASHALGTVPRPWSANLTSAATSSRALKQQLKKQKKKRKWKQKKGGRNGGGGGASNAAKDVGGSKRAEIALAALPRNDSRCLPRTKPHACEAATRASDAKRVIVTLSIGKRSHFAVTRIPMEAYAKRLGADFVVVNSYDHPCLARWNATLRAGANSHFMKLPLLQYFLERYAQVLFLDDDVLVSPFAPDLFSMVPCASIGAVIEDIHAQGWHAMHGRAFCSIYKLEASHPASCGAAAVKHARIFNSGVMVLSQAHRALIDGWDAQELKCKILCDQLYMNAMAVKHDVCVHDLGTGFNLPGTQVRKQLSWNRVRAASRADNANSSAVVTAPPIAGTAVASSCIIHLTVLPGKPYTSHYLLDRTLRHHDLLRAAGAMDQPPMASTQGNASEVPFAARRVLHRAASHAWDCNTVILLFATGDFLDLAINWMQAALSIDVRNFVLVAMDKKLGDVLAGFDAPPGLLLPRVASGDVVISKLNVIGERQRFGLRVLESGFNVLFADLDALFLRSPAPILADGDIIGERIWGRPMSVVKRWGAGICTGFYFMRSTPETIAIFRRTHEMIVTKRAKQPKWQASDQWAINHAVDDHEVEWQTPMPMKGISSFETKFVDEAPAVGYTKKHRSKFVVLPHVHVARSCPILKHGAGAPPADAAKGEHKKYQLWRSLLRKSYALHCFPPDSMPCPKQKHGEKGCDKSVIMGSAVHIHGEVVFDQRQGLWFMKRGWEEAVRKPNDRRDFFAWLRTQHNGAKPGEPPPDA